MFKSMCDKAQTLTTAPSPQNYTIKNKSNLTEVSYSQTTCGYRKSPICDYNLKATDMIHRI